MHERADLPGKSRRANLRIARGMLLHSQQLRLTGRAVSSSFVQNPSRWSTSGASGTTACDLCNCAQALCLEEMLVVPVPTGANFYGEPRCRIDVEFTADLRVRTKILAEPCIACTPRKKLHRHCPQNTATAVRWWMYACRGERRLCR